MDAKVTDLSVEQDVDKAYPPAIVGWMAVAVTFTLYVISALDRNLLTLLVTPIKRDLNLTDVQMGLLYGFGFVIFFALLGLPLGWAIDRFQRRVVIFWGVIGWSIATVLCGFARGFPSFLVTRAGVGAGEAVMAPGAQSMLADLFPRSRLALPLSVYNLGAKVGQGASLMIGGALTGLFPPDSILQLPLIGALKGWQVVFPLIGIPGLVFAFAIFLIPEPKRRLFRGSGSGKNTGYGEYIHFVSRHLRFFLAHHAGKIFFLAVALAVVNWSPAFFLRVHHWSVAQTGYWVGGALLLGPLLGTPINGWIADLLFQRGYSDIHMRYPMFAALAGLPVGVAAFLVVNPYLTVFLIGLFLFIISTYLSMPSVALQVILPSNLRGKAASVQLLVTTLGGAGLGPLAVGFLTDHVFHDPQKIGQSVAVSIAVGLPLVAILFWITLKPLRKMIAALPVSE